MKTKIGIKLHMRCSNSHKKGSVLKSEDSFPTLKTIKKCQNSTKFSLFYNALA